GWGATNVTVQGGVPGRDPTIPAVMFIFGVVGNLIAIVVLCKSRKEQKETTFYTLVFRLAIIELLGTCLDSPVTIATYVQNWWPGGDQLCEYSSFILLFFGLSGLSIICAMSIERYLAINHAYFYNHFVDKKLAGALTSMGLGKTTYLYPQTWCFIDWRTNVSTYAAYSYMYAGFSSFLILVTMLCNVMVCVALIRMQRQFMRWTSLGTDALISDFRRRSSFRRIAGAEIQMVILLIDTSVVCHPDRLHVLHALCVCLCLTVCVALYGAVLMRALNRVKKNSPHTDFCTQRYCTRVFPHPFYARYFLPDENMREDCNTSVELRALTLEHRM
uniref:G-protein coupled receptors family 1 profile domain-containing protein n=1 Tax=Leptobrachium leishanense TaxID=445787 RepID=A0A8C5MI01_9ANUR